MYTKKTLKYFQGATHWVDDIDEPYEENIEAPTEEGVWQDQQMGLFAGTMIVREEDGQIIEVIVPPLCALTVLNGKDEEVCNDLATVLAVLYHKSSAEEFEEDEYHPSYDIDLHPACWKHLQSAEVEYRLENSEYLTLARLGELTNATVRWGSVEAASGLRLHTEAHQLAYRTEIELYREETALVLENPAMRANLASNRMVLAAFLVGLAQRSERERRELTEALRKAWYENPELQQEIEVWTHGLLGHPVWEGARHWRNIASS